MAHGRSAGEVDRQLPVDDEIFLDHVGHFVRDPEAARRALGRAGFQATPISIQVNPDPAGGTPQPSGTGNLTAMFRRGYVEVLFRTADAALGRDLAAALAPHGGPHPPAFAAARSLAARLARHGGLPLAAFAVADAGAAHRRLAQAGFQTQPLVAMQRPVETAEGPHIAAFTIARRAPGQMPEGRIQILTHRTESTVWQPRWLDHHHRPVRLARPTIA